MCDSRQPFNGADSAEALDDYDRLHRCAACWLPAEDGEYCAGHARLGEYRVTDETHWAANE